MFVITNKDDIIICLSKNIEYVNNQDIYSKDKDITISARIINKVYDVDEIPLEIDELKYCYTKESGFYKNQDYKIYYSDEDRLSSLEDIVNMILLRGGIE